MVIASVFAGIITLICQMIFRGIWWTSGGGRRGKGDLGLFVIIAVVVAGVGYFLAIVTQMALSRSREYVADAGSVELTKNPDAMISALQKVSGNAHLHAPQSVRAMFLEDNEEGILGLFVTHPPLEKRIAALQKYAGGRLVERADPITAPPPIGPDAGDAPKPGPWSQANTAAMSSALSTRKLPGSRSAGSSSPPTRSRCSVSTWLPTAANMRRTWW